MKPCYSHFCSFCDLGDFGTEIPQTGDETEPKGPPKLAKKRPIVVEGRPKIGPRAIRELSFEVKSFFFEQNKFTSDFLVFVKNFVANMTPVCRNVAAKTNHKRNNVVANERFKTNM